MGLVTDGDTASAFGFGFGSQGDAVYSVGFGFATDSNASGGCGCCTGDGTFTDGNGFLGGGFGIGAQGDGVVCRGFGVGVGQGVSVRGIYHTHADASVPGGGDLSSDGDAAAFGPCSYFHSLGYFGGVVFPDGNGTTHVVPGYVIAVSENDTTFALVITPYDSTVNIGHAATNNKTISFFQISTNNRTTAVGYVIPHHDPIIRSCDFIPDEDIISPCRFHIFNISAKGDVAYFIIVVAVYAAFGVLGIV